MYFKQWKFLIEQYVIKVNIWMKDSLDLWRRHEKPKSQENRSEIWHSKVMTQYNWTEILSQMVKEKATALMIPISY